MAIDGQPEDILLVPPSPPVSPPLPTFPDWVPPLDTGQTNTGDLNDLSLLRKQTFAARNTIIPISYGRDRVFGQPFVVHVDETTGFLYVAYSFGQGEITGYEISFVDGVDVDDNQTGFLLTTGAAIELHTGVPSPSVSTLLSGVLTGYVDTLPDVAYIVLKVPQGSTRGFPRLEAILQGRRVYDPRLDSTQTTLTPPGSGSHRVGDPSTWVFSTNPAICFRDFIDNFTGWDILDQGIVDCADYNDELIDGVKRREIGLTLNKPSKVEDWVKGFRTYMGAFIAWEGGSIRVITNRPQVIPDQVAMTIGVDDIVKGSLQLTRRSLRSVPNSVAIDYEDSSGAKWHTERVQADSPRVVSGDEARRLSRVSLPGIHNASQAQREAIERLNWYLTDLEATLTLFDEGWQLQHGSIVEVTHPIGLAAKLFRVMRTTALSGRWVVDLVEYDPAVYSNEVIADPTTPDTNLGNPLSPPTIQNLSLAEELFTYKNGLTGSRVRATWTATLYPFLSQYLVEGYVEGVRVWQQFTQANDVVTPPVEEIVDAIGTPAIYEIRVYIQSPFAQGDVVTDTVSIDGKFAVPGDVPNISLTIVAVDQVDISWGEAIDIDIWRYEIRIGTISDTFSSATQLDLVDGLQYSATNLAIGTHRFFIKARDSVGNESDTAIFADVTLNVPSAVLSVSGFEVASEVRLNWPAVVGGFVERYRISYDTSPTPTEEITLDTVDTLRFQTKDVPEGTFEFSIWAQDKNGIEAATAATIIIEVTSDADAFLADTHNFVSPSLTNVVSYTLRLDSRTFYVTNMGDSFAVSPTDFVASDPLANYHSVGASEWLSETKDFGLLLTGSWNLTHDTTALQGNIVVELELSTDDATYTIFTGAAKGEFRYARIRISTFNPPGTATLYVKTPLMRLNINVVPLEESGADTTTASAGIGKTITLSREYTALKEIQVQPKNQTDALTGIVDNIIIGPNTGVHTDTTNYLDGGDIADLDFGATQDFTIECWVKNSGNDTALIRILGKRDGANAGFALLGDETDGDLGLLLEDTSGNLIGPTITGMPNDGSWHHFAVSVDRTADEMRYYLDGVADGGNPIDISSVTAALDAGTAPFRVFADNTGGALWNGGSIDEVRIWDDVRSASEISNNYQTELDMTVTQANLIHYWQMNGKVSTSVTTVADRTPSVTADLTDTGAGDIIYIDPGNASNLIQRVNSFDVFIFDVFGQQLSEQFQWKWKAV